MNAIPFDTLKFSKRLQGVGVASEQADEQSEAVFDALNEAAKTWNLADKVDLQEVKSGLENQIDQTKRELENKIDNTRHDLELKIEETKHDLEGKINESKSTILMWVITLAVTQIGLIIAGIGIAIGYLR